MQVESVHRAVIDRPLLQQGQQTRICTTDLTHGRMAVERIDALVKALHHSPQFSRFPLVHARFVGSAGTHSFMKGQCGSEEADRGRAPEPAQTTTATNKERKICKDRSGHAHLPPASTMDACGSRESCVAYNMQGMPRSVQLYSLTSLQVRRSQSWRQPGEAHRQQRTVAHDAGPQRGSAVPARLGLGLGACDCHTRARQKAQCVC